MEREIFERFSSEISDIREYVKHIKLVDRLGTIDDNNGNLLIKELKDHLKSFRVAKKTFEYKSITISLYGILEKHIGLWVDEFIRKLPSIFLSYNNIPEKMKDYHFSLTIKLLALISEGKHSKYDRLKKESVLKKLGSCIDSPNNFELNGEAFYLHNGNLRHSKISETLNFLDIKLTERLKIVGAREGGFLNRDDHNIASKGTELFNLVDDLVDRRNDIAHGENIDDLLHITELEKYINFLEDYGKTIFQVLSEKLLQFEAEISYKKIEEILGKYNNSVICFTIEKTEICEDDDIIVELNDGGFCKRKILEIQMDNLPYKKLKVANPVNIGIKISNGTSGIKSYYYKKM